MRLIDADKAKQVLRDRLKGEYNVGSALIEGAIVSFLDGQPTAYDVDKVVEELHSEQEVWLRGNNQTLSMGLDHLCPNLSGRAYGVAKAIDIVKRGGVDDTR